MIRRTYGVVANKVIFFHKCINSIPEIIKFCRCLRNTKRKHRVFEVHNLRKSIR